MEIFKDYGIYFNIIFTNFVQMDLIYLLIFVVSIILMTILSGILTKKIMVDMHYKVNSLVWFPLINVFYISAKAAHPLMAFIMFLETILLFPVPHSSNGVWVIDSFAPSNLKSILFVALIIEYILVLLYMIVNYLKYFHQIKIVR